MKLLRKELGPYTQADFCKKIGLRATAIEMYESGNRNVTNRSISLICDKFNIHREWLEIGKGEMFIKSDPSFISNLVIEYNLDDFDQMIIKSYLNLTPPQRIAIKNFAQSLTSALEKDKTNQDQDIERKIEAYRKESEAKQKGEMSSVLDETKEV